MSEFNLPLLRKVVEWAESEARKPSEECEWYQGYFAVAGEEIDRTCGTAYCIAGKVVDEYAVGDHNIRTHTIDGSGDAQIAQELLGIDTQDAWGDLYTWGLFSACNSIEDVREIAERIARKYGQEL